MHERLREFYEDVQRRRTVRDFSARPVPREIIDTALRAAGTAPSGANLQPWHFVVVSGAGTKRRIREAAEIEEAEFYSHRASAEWLAALAPLGTDESKPFLEGKYVAYAAWGQDKALPGEESFSVPYEDLARDRFLLGSADDVVKQIKRYDGDLGVNYLVFRMQWPGMPQAKALEQIERMGRDVIPRLKG